MERNRLLLIHSRHRRRFAPIVVGHKPEWVVGFDRNQWSLWPESAEWATMNKVFCIGSLKPSHFPELLKVPLAWSREQAGECRLYRTKAMVLERPRVVVVVYNPKTATRQRELSHRQLQDATRDLERRFYAETASGIKEKTLLERYRRYLQEKKLADYLQLKIKTNKCGQPALEIKPDKRAIAQKEKTFGKNILF